MEDAKLRTVLSPLIYSLYQLDVNNLPAFNTRYYGSLDIEEIQSIISVINWIEENQNHELTQYLMPLPRQKKLSNEDIRNFLRYINQGLIDNNFHKSED